MKIETIDCKLHSTCRVNMLFTFVFIIELKVLHSILICDMSLGTLTYSLYPNKWCDSRNVMTKTQLARLMNNYYGLVKKRCYSFVYSTYLFSWKRRRLMCSHQSSVKFTMPYTRNEQASTCFENENKFNFNIYVN